MWEPTALNKEQTDNVLETLCLVLDCPAHHPDTCDRAKCAEWSAEFDGECNQIYCWTEFLKEKNYNPFTTLQGGMTK